MKALYQLNGEPGKVEGPAAGVLNQLAELSQNDTSFVAHRMFITTPELTALAAADEQSDLLDQFIICLDDEAKPTFNAAAGFVSNTSYVTEDNMELNFERGLQTDDDASGQLGGDSLDMPGLFDDEDGNVSYAGAAGTHNSEGLDLMEMPWGAPAKSHSKDSSTQQNAQNAPAQRSGTEEPLDVLDMKW